MPTYDYECDACGHKFELFQSIVADAERKCPKCKRLKLRRLLMAVQSFSRARAFTRPTIAAICTRSRPCDKSGAESKSSESKPAEAKSESKPAAAKSEGGKSKDKK